jgi:hypothetical protein
VRDEGGPGCVLLYLSSTRPASLGFWAVVASPALRMGAQWPALGFMMGSTHSHISLL